MVVPAAPVVPGDDHRGVGPKAALRERLHPLACPGVPGRDGAAAPRVFAVCVGRVQPGHVGQEALVQICVELRRGHVPRVVLERLDVGEVRGLRLRVVAPLPAMLLQHRRQALQIVRW